MKRGKIIVKKNSKGEWQVFWKGANGESLVDSKDGYKNKKDALAVMNLIRYRSWMFKVVVES